VLNDVDQLVKRTELTGGGGLKADVRGDSILCVLHVCAAAAAEDAFIRTAPHPAPPSLRRPTLIDGAAPVTGHLPPLPSPAGNHHRGVELWGDYNNKKFGT